MKCISCGVGVMKPGVTSELLERDSHSVVIRGVPALVCEHCGEVYFTAEVTRQLLLIADEAFAAGKDVVLKQFKAA